MSSKTSPLTPHPRRGSVGRLLLLTAGIAGALVASAALTQQQPQPPAQPKPAQAQPIQAQPPKGQKGPPVQPGSLTFNTVITKLMEGKQIFSNTVTNPDLEAAKKACVGQDFIWIEM